MLRRQTNFVLEITWTCASTTRLAAHSKQQSRHNLGVSQIQVAATMTVSVALLRLMRCFV